jgi:hypothetical protein
MLRYSRWSPREVLPEVETHVRQHLSSVADPFDDPTAHPANVRITHIEQDGGVLIVGELDAEPDAPYLREDYEPYRDVDAEILRAAGLES